MIEFFSQESVTENGTDSNVNDSGDRPVPVDKKTKRKTEEKEEDSMDERLAKRWVMEFQCIICVQG